MKLVYIFTLLLSACFGMKDVKSRPETAEMTQDNPKSKKSFYDFKVSSLEGQEIDFSKYKGKKVLLVNVASKCGFTPQYKELQQLHEQYGEKVVILGFPANNFGKQEPGTKEEIAEFCQKNYGVDFQMFDKISVAGEDKHPLYKWLSDKSLNGWNDQEPKWNFSKYLVNEKGELVKYYASAVSPMSDEIVNEIKK